MPRADIEAVEDVIMRVGAMVDRHPEVTELDLNPVIVSPDGALVVDWRVRVDNTPMEAPLGAH